MWRSFRIFCGAMTVFFFFGGIANAGLLPEPPHSVGPPSPPVAAINSNDPHNTRGGDFTNLAPASERTAGNPADAPGALICALVTFLIAVGMKPAVRRKFHSALGSLIAKGEAKAAATVAGLVGGRSASEALKHGTATFRGLPLQSLALSDLTTNDDTGLHAKTVKASLGEVHAFLSHSWHDEADAKWEVLSAWGAKKQTPLLWLDKACIDQQRIDESLAALPVYLSGCQDLLVVVGPTYTRRLWCVMELFVFLQMGGSLDRVTALTLPGKEVQRELATFDASKAQCFKAEDRERLLGIIESSFGDFGTFNATVRKIFVKRSTTLENFGAVAV